MDRMAFLVENDQLIRQFGMTVEEARPGYARVSVVVRSDFLNAHDVAHGALVFAVADVAFALAVNADIDAMGIQWSFNILRAAHRGDEIVAECRTLHQGSRLIIVEYEVRGRAGALLAKGMATAMPVHPERVRRQGGARHRDEDRRETNEV